MPSSTLGSRGDRGVWGDTRAPRPGSAGSAQFPAGRNLNGQKNAIHNLCGPSFEFELWKMEKKNNPDGTNKNFRYEKYPQSP